MCLKYKVYKILSNVIEKTVGSFTLSMFHVFLAVLCVCFCTGLFVMAPLKWTCFHCLQRSFFQFLLHVTLDFNENLLE